MRTVVRKRQAMQIIGQWYGGQDDELISVLEAKGYKVMVQKDLNTHIEYHQVDDVVLNADELVQRDPVLAVLGPDLWEHVALNVGEYLCLADGRLRTHSQQFIDSDWETETTP